MAGYALTLATAQEGEPVTRQEAQQHLRSTRAEEGPYVDRLVAAAREAVENDTRRQLMPATWDVSFPCWPGALFELPKPPLASATVVVTYVDVDGTTQTLSTSCYGVIQKAPDSPFGQIYLKRQYSWPTLCGQHGALEVTVRAQCGYALATADISAQRAAVPQRAKQAILLLVADMDANREIGGIGSVRIPTNPVYEALIAQLAVPILETAPRSKPWQT